MNDVKHLVISKIKDGTVIDHITPGLAILVLKILGIKPKSSEAVSMAMNVESAKMGKKDIVKVEGKYIGDQELNKIALIAPEATINLIQNYEIIRKFNVKPPEVVENIIKCPNPNCISNSNEPIKSRFRIFLDESRVKAVCDYCGRKLINLEDYI
ncbi:aspartate carbamoyltransferase, regulatory subunit [Archaeoglobus sulfaticallidus PM70-1]|uniref:Aspartate carbamoyltransferase regulatory chain n=1 Tax=Archaeoglobus sulfaticallidus PM70-1 TaxID=387631 RepID=N0BDW3_9EURY|nr:aspartate carbamoyltransferase regulatory subunit [Archaeoglobus sulfaticallidus]AGK61198.1 aspartate carbamoyltransferase, regulatory subunit [Archaeoglobus sulfaticallidus PM70-1]